MTEATAQPVLASLPRPADDLPADPVALEQLEKTLRAYLFKPPFWLTFEPALERRFEQRARDGRMKRFRLGLGAAALVCVALTLLELVLLPQLWLITVMVRGAMLVLLLAVGWWVLPRHSERFSREWITGLLLAGLGVAQVALAWAQGASLKPVHEGTLLLLLLLCNQMTRVRYRVALPLTVFWLLLYLLQEILLQTAGEISLLLSVAFAGLLAWMSLAAKRAMELDNRATHVLKRLNAISEYRLAQANLSKTRFLAAASHDLRQPVHALSLFINALRSEGMPEQAAVLVGNMERSVEALKQLLGTLLDISRLDANVIDVQHTDFSLHAMFELLHDEYAPQARMKGLAFTLHSDASLAVRSDRALLETVLRNLLSNAIRYTDSGGITLQGERIGDMVHISVRDTGMGIPEAQQQEVFREFVQLHNPERDRAKGLGLGLAIVERTLRLLGHALELESRSGEGSRFCVSVPAVDASSVTEAMDSVVHADLQGMRVVVIDDDAEVREGTQALLSRWGVETILAVSAADALRKLDGRHPHVILADFRLRDGENGAQAIAQLRARFAREIPALIVTGDTDPQRLQEAKASGHALLHKPAQPAKISAFLRRHWRSARR